MTDYERGVEQASTVYKETLREFILSPVLQKSFDPTNRPLSVPPLDVAANYKLEERE